MENKQIPQVVYVAVDIEKTGATFTQHKVMSVGFFVGDRNGKCLETKRFNLDVKFPSGDNFGDFEERCWIEFWSKLDSKIVDILTTDPLPQKEGWVSIGKFVDSLEEKYPNAKIKFLTNNASFDIANIDYNLEVHCSRLPMRYSTKGRYRSVVSADDMLDMLPNSLYTAARERIHNTVKHDHDPVNDAHSIYLQYIEAILYKEKLEDAHRLKETLDRHFERSLLSSS